MKFIEKCLKLNLHQVFIEIFDFSRHKCILRHENTAGYLLHATKKFCIFSDLKIWIDHVIHVIVVTWLEHISRWFRSYKDMTSMTMFACWPQFIVILNVFLIVVSPITKLNTVVLSPKSSILHKKVILYSSVPPYTWIYTVLFGVLIL